MADWEPWGTLYSAFTLVLYTCLVQTRLVGNSNNTTSRSWPSITRLLALRMPALSKVISAPMDNNCSSKNTVLADQLDQAITN